MFVRTLSCGVTGLLASLSVGQWSATILSSDGFLWASGLSIGSSGVLGYGVVNDESSHALLWQPGSTTYIDLHPTGYTSSVGYGTKGNSQIGTGGFFDGFSVRDHALLWHGTASSVVDLNPTGWNTVGLGGSENSQVGQGWGDVPGDGSALLWHGSASSMIVLAPDGANQSWAGDATDSSQVGAVSPTLGTSYAALWHGSKASIVNLNPIWAGESIASGVYGSQQVGNGYIYDEDGFFVSHAVMWNGSAESAIDLNPIGFENSYCTDIAGQFQVGAGRGFSPNHLPHALVWQGNAESYFDLNNVLPANFEYSAAYGVTEDGTIVGYGVDSEGNRHVVKWTHVVPEPNVALATLIGVGFLIRRRRTTRRIQK
jgi:hypothetical protein